MKTGEIMTLLVFILYLVASRKSCKPFIDCWVFENLKTSSFNFSTIFLTILFMTERIALFPHMYNNLLSFSFDKVRNLSNFCQVLHALFLKIKLNRILTFVSKYKNSEKEISPSGYLSLCLLI